MLKFFIVLACLFVSIHSSPNGGWKDEIAITDEIMDLARWTTSQLSTFTNVVGDHSVMRVHSVKSQVVSGMNYKFTIDVLIAGPHNTYSSQACNVSIFVQPWTNTKQFNEAPVCGPSEIQITSKRASAGGWTEQSEISDEVYEIAKWTTSLLSEYTNSNGLHSVLRVRNLKTQIVSGVNYKFTLDVSIAGPHSTYSAKSCNISVFVQPWTNTKQFNEAPVCGPSEIQITSRRDVGDWKDEIGITDEIMDLARWTTSQLSTFTNVVGDHSVMRVHSVKSQVVSGMNYKFTIDVLIAGPHNTYSSQACNVSIFVQPWTNTKQFNEAPVCGPSEIQITSKRDDYENEKIYNAWENKTEVTEEIMEVAKWTTSQLSSFTNLVGEHNLLRVHNIQTQVAGGINYRFTLEVSIAGPNHTYTSRQCNVTVNVQWWLDLKKFTETPVCGPSELTVVS